MKVCFFFGQFVLYVSLLVMSPSAMAWDGLVVIGDSLATGTAANPRVMFDPKALWDLAVAEENQTSSAATPSPVRLWPSKRENDGSVGWIWSYGVQAFSRKVFDSEEMAAGFKLGQMLGFDAAQVWIAGDGQAMADDALTQVSRMLDRSSDELPSYVAFMYSGNDLCSSNYDLMTYAEEFSQGLRNAILYLSRRGLSKSGETTKILVMGYLPVLDIFVEPVIAAKKVSFFGTESTCGEMRKAHYLATDDQKMKAMVGNDDPMFAAFSQFVPPNPFLFCPTLFSTFDNENENQKIIANRIRLYREEQKKLVDSLNADLQSIQTLSRIELVFVETTTGMKFAAEDIAQDCFHLSEAGHTKLAEVILKQLR
jgi:hypothetical protein